MKKLFIAIVLLCLVCCAAYAEEPKELTYRNIPWGTSVDKISDPASVYSYESRETLINSAFQVVKQPHMWYNKSTTEPIKSRG